MRRRIQQVKQFVMQHPTATACVVTAAVSWKLSHDITIKGVLEETTALSYAWGLKAGQLEMLLDEAYNFIRQQDLDDQFIKFANMVEVKAT